MSRYIPLDQLPERQKEFLLENGRKIIDRVFARLTSRGSKGDEWTGRVDVDAAWQVFERLLEGETIQGLNAVVLNGSHLFIYSLGAAWFNPDEPWLIEQFFIRLFPGPSDGAFEAIEELAEDLGASATVMATSLAPDDASLGRLYEAHGYRLQSSQYIKG